MKSRNGAGGKKVTLDDVLAQLNSQIREYMRDGNFHIQVIGVRRTANSRYLRILTAPSDQYTFDVADLE